MVDLLIEGGTVLTMNSNRDVLKNSAVAVDDGNIVAVGPRDTVMSDHDADRIINATGHAVLPGFISTHAHISDTLLRGREKDRSLFDWLYNVKKPGIHTMSPKEHAIASALYCQEAVQSGITTVMENGTGAGNGYSPDVIDAKMRVYSQAGLRNIFGQGFSDRSLSPTVQSFIERVADKEPTVDHYFPDTQDTESVLDAIESTIESYHGTADGRQSVWPCPGVAWGVTPEGLRGAYEIAERHDTMTTTHAAETIHEEMGHLSTIEYLHSANYLGKRTLLGHCVHIDDRDIRLLSATGTKVAHNPLTNLALGSGIAPVPEMINSGVTVGLGTDNTSGSDTVNMINDLRFAALIHKGNKQDPGAITGKKVLEMATIEAAKAIGRESDLGSIEPDKQADIAIIDFDYSHFIPHPDIVSSIVYQAQGFEVDTVICNGEVIMEGRTVYGIEDNYPDLINKASDAAADLCDRIGIPQTESTWESISST